MFIMKDFWMLILPMRVKAIAFNQDLRYQFDLNGTHCI